MLNNTWTILGLTFLCLWSIGWGWWYHRQMKAWKRRATVAEYMLRKIRSELKSEMGHVDIATEAQLDDVLIDAEIAR